ncbi:MAG: HAD family hydrolase [Ruminococcaceae bacterium]|nr:HAD family hydrolase [Oscillospiraceae bacterium]
MQRYLLFDLDGTLTDPGEGITNCVGYALRRFGVEPQSREELYPYIGPPLVPSFMQFHGLSEGQAKQALLYYRERFSTKGMFENKPYPGIEDFLHRLQEEGFRLMVATSKPEEFTVQILAHFGLDVYFDFVGGNTLQESRPTKADVIRYVMEHHPDITRQNALMIGDRHHDVDGAHACGLRAVGVLYGYGDRPELEQAGAEAMADDLTQLYAVIHSLFSN